MRHVNRSALVPYRARDMFLLVDDVAAYPEFLPWCNDTEIHERNGDVVDATLELHKGHLSHHFRTRNERNEFDSIDISLVGGPFRCLEGGWRFDDYEDQGCKVSLQLKFEFESMITDVMFGSFFEETCNSLVDAFVRRAESVFGAR